MITTQLIPLLLLLCFTGTSEAQFFVQLANWLANGIAQSANQNPQIPQSAVNFQGQPVANPPVQSQQQVANIPGPFVAQPQVPQVPADVSLLQSNPNVLSFLNSGTGPTIIPTLPPTIITVERLTTERVATPAFLQPTSDGITSQFAPVVQPRIVPDYLNREAQNYSDNVQSVLNRLGYIQAASTPPAALPTVPSLRRINHFPTNSPDGPKFLSTQSTHFQNVLQRLGLNSAGRSTNIQPPSFGAPGTNDFLSASLPPSVIFAPQGTTARAPVSADKVITFPPATTPVVSTTTPSLTELQAVQQRLVLEEQIKRLRQQNDRLAVENSVNSTESRGVSRPIPIDSILSPTDSTKSFTRAQDFEFAQLPQLAPISSGPERTLAEKLGVETGPNAWLIPYKPKEGR